MYNIESTIKLNNGVGMPRFGLGVWQVKDEAELDESVKAALEAGYKHIDTAAAYQNEDMVGRAIKKFGKREDLFVTTKLNARNLDKAPGELEDSLRKLDMDYVDLYLIHWPMPKKGLIYVDAWKNMVDLYNQGKAKAIGVSNFDPEHIEKIYDATGVMPMVNQVERHPLYQQKELEAYCREKDIVTEGYSPLASGHMGDFADKVQPIADKYNKSVAQVILRWHLQTDWVLIPKSVHAKRVKENADIFDFELTAEDLAVIDALDCGDKLLPKPNEADW